MKECCDENLKSALARLFYDVFSGWKELSRNGVLQYPLMFISRRDRKICVFIKEIADNPYTIDNLRSFIEHVDYLYHMTKF